MATLNPAAARGAPYRVPRETNRWPSVALAIVMHAALLLFLWAGVSWQNTAPVAVEAEVWDMKVQTAAPPPPPPQVVEETPPPPPPVAAPKVEEEPPPAVKPPDIALEKAKQKAEQKKLLDQKRADEKLARLQKAADEKKARELAEKQAAEKAAADKKLADKLAKSKQGIAEQKRLDALRAAEMARITGAGTSGEAARATAPRMDTGYNAAITAKIKSNTSYLGNTDVPGNPHTTFSIQQLPTGEIISVKLLKSSGLPAFDDAVEKGIIKSSPLPKKKDGTVERTLEIGFSMKDLT